jgi:hypothetical protein
VAMLESTSIFKNEYSAVRMEATVAARLAAHHLMATGLTGVPTAPVKGWGEASKRKL